MDKPTMLFLDTRLKRLDAVRRQDDFEVTIVTGVASCLRQLSQRDFDVVSLEIDLCRDFEDPDSILCGMEVIRYLEKTGWPEGKKKPRFFVHSTNTFGAFLMQRHLSALDLFAEWHPIHDYQSPHQS